MHSAFGLRYLYANLGVLTAKACIKEFTINERPLDIAESVLRHQPRILGIGVYIWNVSAVTQLVALLKQINPELIVVLGGPEVSHSPDHPDVTDLADYIIQGAGEIVFKDLCEQLLSGNRPVEKLIQSRETSLDKLALPYQYYTDEDIRNRMIYVEASRGCPFKCEFCLSSLDKTSKPFELSRFLEEMENLFERGARNFKFIDRTFNLKVSTSIAILEFFLERMTDDLYLHFEVIPDNLPEKLKAVLVLFPEHSLQFEIGVQTFDPQIQQLISRKQDNQKTCDNLAWLRNNTRAYLHTDLIFGLPGDTLENFAHSFNRLAALNPHEIQLGILKRLRGAPINRHNSLYQLRYNPDAPYNILQTASISFLSMQRVGRFARYWDMIGNSGRFRQTLPLVLQENAFENFLLLTDAIYEQVGSTWKISLKNLFVLLYDKMVSVLGVSEESAFSCLEQDYRRCGEKGSLMQLLKRPEKTAATGVANKRQRQLLR